MPCHIPAHRKAPVADASARKQMVLNAISGIPEFKLEECELIRNSPSYMVDSLQILRERYGYKQPLCLILGADAFANITTWHEWERLLELTHLAVFNRPDSPFQVPPLLDALYPNCVVSEADKLKSMSAGLIIHLKDGLPLAVSSTQIRDALRLNQDPRFMLPDAVWRYIRYHSIYKETPDL